MVLDIDDPLGDQVHDGDDPLDRSGVSVVGRLATQVRHRSGDAGAPLGWMVEVPGGHGSICTSSQSVTPAGEALLPPRIGLDEPDGFEGLASAASTVGPWNVAESSSSASPKRWPRRSSPLP